ncbi:MAG: VOC family protein [Gammaproteobacteria bacterium]|nr:VOC family protein [Gammaproteobacteria bacterium]
MKFGYTIHYVSNVDKALLFFEKAFGMKRKFMTDEKDYGELDTGETVLSFASHELGKSNFHGGYVSASESKEPLGVEIALITDDVASAHSNAIESGAVELKAPASKPWGQVVSYVRCPSGVLLELCTPIGG